MLINILVYIGEAFSYVTAKVFLCRNPTVSVSYDADTLKNGIVIKRGKKNFNKLILK